MGELTLSLLAEANMKRLPLFKNRHGELAHNRSNGSDWTVAQWLQALVGELGEFAEVRLRYESGEINAEVYKQRAEEELADVMTYLSILAKRALDTGTSKDKHPSKSIMGGIALLGLFANARKKYERGDYSFNEYCAEVIDPLNSLRELVDWNFYFGDKNKSGLDGSNGVNPNGIDLGAATVRKFNDVSERVGANIFIQPSLIVSSHRT